MMGVLDLWNLAIIPSLMNNCSTWIGITNTLEQKLESIQEQFIRLMMEVPVSTPKVALRAETGLLSMKHRVWVDKISLVMAIKRSTGLANQLYKEQAAQGWPGLAIETRKICEEIGISDINQNDITKKDIMKAVKAHDGIELHERMKYHKDNSP